jgi:hypothetical protein
VSEARYGTNQGKLHLSSFDGQPESSVRQTAMISHCDGEKHWVTDSKERMAGRNEDMGFSQGVALDRFA